jgi:hypothetical protein
MSSVDCNLAIPTLVPPPLPLLLAGKDQGIGIRGSVCSQSKKPLKLRGVSRIQSPEGATWGVGNQPASERTAECELGPAS